MAIEKAIVEDAPETPVDGAEAEPALPQIHPYRGAGRAVPEEVTA